MLHSLSSYRTAVNPARIDLLEWGSGPLDFVKAAGAWIEDEDGRRYLDLLCGYGAATLGHRHPAILDSIREALDSAEPFTNPHNISRTAGVLARKLCQLAGANLKKVYFGNSGSEGIEAALKFAMAYTGRGKFLSFEGGFHGFTTGSLSLAGNDSLKRPFPGISLRSEQLPFGDLNRLEQHLKEGEIAGVVLEPVQGMSGARAWNGEDLLTLQRLCREHGTAVILDEVLTGIGRTGKWFAFQHTPGFEPDIVVVSKGLTGGVVPISATLMTDEIYTAVYQGVGRAEIHASTFEAHLLGAMVGSAVIDVIQENDLLNRVTVLSEQLEQELTTLESKGAPITDIRGSGLLMSFEVSDRFDMDQELWGAPGLRHRLLAGGVFTNVAAQATNRINILPPLTLTDNEAKFFLKQLNHLVL